MKTRIIHTKLHFEDDWFNTLPIEYKYPFIYLFTNSHIGLSGTYELPERVALIETGCSKELWDKAKKHFQKHKKVGFYENWVCIVNAHKHSNYKGVKNGIALCRELDTIPDRVKEHFNDTLSIHYTYPIDTTINHKSKIITHNTEIIDLDKLDEEISKNRKAL